MHISYVFAQGYAGLPVNDLHSDGRIALSFENIIDQVLWGKIDVASAMRVVFTEHTLWIKAAQAPAEDRETELHSLTDSGLAYERATWMSPQDHLKR